MGFKNIMKSQFLHPFITTIKSYLVLILKRLTVFSLKSASQGNVHLLCIYKRNVEGVRTWQFLIKGEEGGSEKTQKMVT